MDITSKHFSNAGKRLWPRRQFLFLSLLSSLWFAALYFSPKNKLIQVNINYFFLRLGSVIFVGINQTSENRTEQNLTKNHCEWMHSYSYSFNFIASVNLQPYLKIHSRFLTQNPASSQQKKNQRTQLAYAPYQYTKWRSLSSTLRTWWKNTRPTSRILIQSASPQLTSKMYWLVFSIAG